MAQETNPSVIQITCTRHATVYHNAENGWTVAKYETADKTRQRFTAVGNYLPVTDAPVILTGVFKDAKYGKQFEVSSFEYVPPDNLGDFVRVVSSLGVGFGEKRAAKLYAVLGCNAWAMLESGELPPQAQRVAGKEALDRLVEKLQSTTFERDLMRLIGNQVSVDIQEMRRDRCTAAVVEENPYILCRYGGSFEAVDEFALRGEFAHAETPSRIECALHVALKSALQQGSTCVPKNILFYGDKRRGITGAMTLLNRMGNTVTEQKADEVLMAACERKRIMLNSGYFYTKETLAEECFVAKKLVAMTRQKVDCKDISVYAKEMSKYEQKEGITLSDEQRQVVLGALQQGVSVITGFPGSGKTTIIKCILYLMKEVEGLNQQAVLLLSPTGKAARRMEEATGSPASTILSALKYNGHNTEEILKEEWPLERSVFIVDEISMSDLLQFTMLLRHVDFGSRLILIGDPDQLPSVGAGNVLHDVIASGVIPVYRLTQIFRQKSGEDVNLIPLNAEVIRAGNVRMLWGKNRASAFLYAPREREEDSFAAACSLYHTLVSSQSFTTDDVALLVPYRKKNKATCLTASAFNAELQSKLNPGRSDELTISAHGMTFRKGDKVMQLVNTEGPKNGDVGYIQRIALERLNGSDRAERVAYISFGDEVIPYSGKMMGDIDLAYASSVHKMQGAEVDTVILVVSEVHSNLLQRNLVYTAITRAIKHVIIVGQLDAFYKAIGRDSTADPTMTRITLLAPRLYAQAKSKT